MIGYGEKIKNLRKEKGLTQEQLADLINIGRSALSLYEIEARQPDPETLKNIANALNVSTDYLLGRSPIRQLSIDDQNIENMELREGKKADEIPSDRIEEISKALSNLQSDLDKLKKALSKNV